MSQNFLFDAPTYLDFNLHKEEDSGGVETYFDIDHEFTPVEKRTRNSKGSTPHSVYLDIPNDAELIKYTSLADLQQENAIYDRQKNNMGIYCEKRSVKLRKSISAGNLLNMEDLTERTRQAPFFDIDSKNCSQPSLLKKSNFKERINLLAQPKRTTQAKYVSTAEQINKFYGTPTRFHSWQKKVEIPNQQSKPHSLVTPESPALATKLRSRNNNVLSRDEIEKQEMEEFKKYKIKARPLNPRILHGLIKPFAIPKRPSTVVKPFNLSENPKKEAQTTSENPETYEFHARAMPKAIYERSHSETKLEQKQNHNPTVSGSKEKLKIQTVKPASIEISSKPIQPTQPSPFSFETRDRQLIKRREALINKVLEEEKQAREFRANPAPKFISKKSASLTSLKATKSGCDSNDPPPIFKAKPPTVLYQKPFEPKKSERVLFEVTDVCLNTDRRAKEREEFEKKQQEKRERIAVERFQRERYQTRMEEEEISRLRKETVHTAQPIKRYKELKIEPSGKITTPMTPNFKTSERVKIQHKENAHSCK